MKHIISVEIGERRLQCYVPQIIKEIYTYKDQNTCSTKIAIHSKNNTQYTASILDLELSHFSVEYILDEILESAIKRFENEIIPIKVEIDPRFTVLFEIDAPDAWI